jgi:hypothetical protein
VRVREGHEERRRAVVGVAVSSVIACGALLGACADGGPVPVRLGAEASQEPEAELDVDCPDLPASPPPGSLVVCASVQGAGGEPRYVGGPGDVDPLTEVLLAQGYCAVAPLAEDPDADDGEALDTSLPDDCLPSSVPLDLSGVSEDDRTMIENLLSVPDPEFTIAP